VGDPRRHRRGATLDRENVGSLYVRVGRWIELLSRHWKDAVPKDSEDAQELLYDVVSATVRADGAKIHPWSAAA
jgi:hypothetical protein